MLQLIPRMSRYLHKMSFSGICCFWTHVSKPLHTHCKFNVGTSLCFRTPVESSQLQTVDLFHTTTRRQIAPVFWMFVKPVAKALTIISGRTFRKWWRNMPANERARWRKTLFLSRHRIMLLGGVVLVAFGVNYAAHIQTTPFTGRRRYIAFTEDQFAEIVQLEYDMQMEAAKGHMLPGGHPFCGRVARVAERIMKKNQDVEFMRKQKWTVIVVDAREQNAFVLPSGHIFVYTGLLDVVENDDQLAIVLAHEMSHAMLNHGAEQVSFAQVLDVAIILVMAVIWALMPTDGIAIVTQWFHNKVIQLLLHLPYNRKLEAEADEVGLQLAAKACYDVRESSAFWQKMALIEDLPGSQKTPPEWLSTHPNHENRAGKLDELIPQALELRSSCQCGTLPSTDPRQRLYFLQQMKT